jgi:hypothetical protein
LATEAAVVISYDFEQPITYKRYASFSPYLASVFHRIEQAPCQDCSDWVIAYSNPAYLPVSDARAMAAFVKTGMTIVEVGCGYSTLLMRQCVGPSGTIEGIDPEPRCDCEAVLSVHRRFPLQECNLYVFADADIASLDGTHYAFDETEVTTFIFECLPRLKKGALVHFHDIFLPFEYPEEWSGRHYNEQVMVGALLLGGNNYKIEWASHYGGMMGWCEKGGSSLWLRKMVDAC